MSPKPASVKPSSLQEVLKVGTSIISIQSLAADLKNLKEIVMKQSEIIDCLKSESSVKDRKLSDLEQRFESYKTLNDSLHKVKDRINDELRSQLNRQEQFGRRYCMSVDGIPKERGEKRENLREKVEKILSSADGDITMQDVDKFHRNGPAADGEQEVIIRFKTHTAKEVMYKHRKSVKVGYPVYLKPNLTEVSKREYLKARNYVKNLDKSKFENPPEFVMANVHGILLLKMAEPGNDHGCWIEFSNADDLPDKINFAQPHWDPFYLDRLEFDMD